jgi:colicin import membrane protein
MKTGMTISIVGHAAALLLGLVTLAAAPYDPTPVDSLPVDIVSDADFSRMTAGAKNAPKAEAPKPLVEKIDEPKAAEAPEAKVSEKPEIVTASAEPTPPVPEAKIPEPKPAPAPPEARPEPKKPEPKSAESKPDPISEMLKKEKAKEAEPKKAAAQIPKPRRKPPPPQPAFDANRIAALLDKREPQRQAAAGAEINRTPGLGTIQGNAAHLTQTEIDALRAQIQACWNPPAGATEGRELVVQIRIMLRPDGSLSAEPMLLNRGSNPFFQVAAESAMRAVRRCQPYHLPIAKYEVWKDVEVTFDPRDLYRG